MMLLPLSLLLPCTGVLSAAGRDHGVTQKIGIRMCRVKCIQHCKIVLSRSDDSTCRLSKDVQDDSAEDVYIINQQDKRNIQVFAHACSQLTCRQLGKFPFYELSQREDGGPFPNILGKRCKTDKDCPVRNFVCFVMRTCKCIPGFSFNPGDHTCVRRCQVYGDKSTIYGGLAITGYNDRQFPTNTKQECSNACVRETEFTCISFDFLLLPGTCALSRHGYLDVPVEQREVTTPLWYHGTRHCA